MKATSFFGYKCPECGATIDIGAVVGSTEVKCPSCGSLMEPDRRGRTSTANAYCPNCKAFFGLVNSDRCPRCGGPFSTPA